MNNKTKLNFCVPCLLGLEGLVADELKRLDMKDVMAENGRVLFTGGMEEAAAANVSLGCGERVLIFMGEFPSHTFDELFEGVKALPWEELIPKDGEFPVKGYSLNSALHSIPDCQRIIKKATADRLGSAYGMERLPEDGSKYQIQFSIVRDKASLFIDTTGAPLYKRGYRAESGVAPIRETLAAAMVKLSRFRGRESFCDPFCGSGTIAIEAALAALNRAPGLSRRFSAMDWALIDPEIWTRARDSAKSREFSGSYDIEGRDFDPKCVETAQANAHRAGVSDHVRFSVADVRSFSHPAAAGILVTNPPYGSRLLELREAEELYRAFGRALKGYDGWKKYIISSHPEFERCFGSPADKKRKLYNGMIKCDLFMYLS